MGAQVIPLKKARDITEARKYSFTYNISPRYVCESSQSFRSFPWRRKVLKLSSALGSLSVAVHFAIPSIISR